MQRSGAGARRPHVVLLSLTSVDGRLDGFPADLGLYYELAGAVPHEAVLTGSGTMVAAAAADGVDLAAQDPEPPSAVEPDPAAEPDARPVLVLVDSGGRVTRFAWLRAVPYWRDVLVLCSSATPAVHRDRLRRHRVPHLVVGEDRVDLAAALGLLAGRYAVRAVRVDAGGGLAGALVRAGLVDELRLVVAPYLAGDATDRPLRLVDRIGTDAARPLRLEAVERLRAGHTLLRYVVPEA
nr:5-amino-6-(5-phosphoribosylamino)uracil reductase [uncultured bacterium]